ncbi:MAG TPA: efflux RND transporter permease subunit [Bryobacteraceae bacterium]|jgi:HAE1 family hydrophobic/amphiphilic exporter-1
MNLTALFIQRPVMTALVMMGILLFGISGYRSLPVSDLPNIDFPTLQVQASLPGASPETIAAAVATPLERQFSTVPGLDSMTSLSGRGQTNITLQFTLDRNIDSASQDVQSAVAAVLKRLPTSMPAPPTVQKVNPADQPILFMGLNSKTLSLTQVDEYAETLIAPRISTISGVAQVNVFGAAKYAVRAQLDPAQLVSRGIGIDEVVQSIQKHNVNTPSGTLWGPKQAFTLITEGQVMNAAAYRPLIVAYRNGNPVRLDELGDVLDSVQDTRNYAWLNNTRSIMFQVQRQPGTNTVEVVNRINALLPEFTGPHGLLPPSVNLETVYDRSASIRESVDDVKFSLELAIVLVVLVIFVFLRNVSATIIPSLALPLSVVGTFAAMQLLGYTLDNLSLMALTLAVGFVVDDAIVVLENIVRHMEMGKPRIVAALEGGREIAFTILSMTLSLAAVFIPVLFMGGIIGRLFHEFAVVIMVSILISGFVSLSLTPMLCSRFLKPPSEHHNALFRASERVFDGLRDAYGWTLRGVVRHRFISLIVACGTVAATVYLYRLVPTGFIPSQDTGQISASTELPQDASFEAMAKSQFQAAAVVMADPNVDALFSGVNASGGNNGANAGRMQLRLKPRAQRTMTPEQIIEELRPKLNAIPGIRTYLTNPPLIRIGGQQSRSLYQYTLQAQNLDILYGSAREFEKRLHEIPQLTDVNSDLQITSPQVKVEIDRDRASAVGVTADQIEDALYSAYGTRQVSDIYTPTNDYWVMLELKPKYQLDPTSLGMLYVRSASGKLIPLSTVTRPRSTVGPLAVTHLGQLPSVTMSFNLAPGVSLGDAVARIDEAARELPAEVHTSFQGVAAAFQSSLTGMGFLLLMAILVIYMVLGILYESFIHPLTILSGLPSAGLGALATLLVFKNELNIYSFVGVIMLVGIVKKNAIMMIDFALEAQRTQSMTPAEAIYEACLVRFRPIMMTTMAALMGTLPIALGLGAGAEARRPLGLAVVGGLVVSQLLTLYITPVVYIYMERGRSLFSKKKPQRRSGATGVRPLPEPAGALGD